MEAEHCRIQSLEDRWKSERKPICCSAQPQPPSDSRSISSTSSASCSALLPTPLKSRSRLPSSTSTCVPVSALPGLRGTDIALGVALGTPRLPPSSPTPNASLLATASSLGWLGRGGAMLAPPLSGAMCICVCAPSASASRPPRDRQSSVESSVSCPVSPVRCASLARTSPPAALSVSCSPPALPPPGTRSAGGIITREPTLRADPTPLSSLPATLDPDVACDSDGPLSTCNAPSVLPPLAILRPARPFPPASSPSLPPSTRSGKCSSTGSLPAGARGGTAPTAAGGPASALRVTSAGVRGCVAETAVGSAISSRRRWLSSASG